MRSRPYASVALVAALALLAVASLASPAAARTLTTTMSGSEEAPTPGDPDATGNAVIELNLGRRTVCYELDWQNVTTNAQNAHIHKGPPGVAGPIVVNLFLNENFPGTGSTSGCTTGVNRNLLRDIKRNPADYYVNVHSNVFPAGAIRGQLGD